MIILQANVKNMLHSFSILNNNVLECNIVFALNALLIN